MNLTKASIYLYKSEYQELCHYFLRYENGDLFRKISIEYQDEYNPVYFSEQELTEVLILLPKSEIKLRLKFQKAGENVFKWK